MSAGSTSEVAGALSRGNALACSKGTYRYWLEIVGVPPMSALSLRAVSMSNTSNKSESSPRRRFYVRLVKPSPAIKGGYRGAARPPAAVTMPGYIGGVHHTVYVSAIRALKTSGQRADLEQLLLRLIDTTEDEARHTRCAVSSGYYHELSRLYRKAGETAKEHAVLKRFASQTHAPGARSARLVKRFTDAHASGRASHASPAADVETKTDGDQIPGTYPLTP